MKILEIRGINYTVSALDIATFLNEYIYSDMISEGSMKQFNPEEDNTEELIEVFQELEEFIEEFEYFIEQV